MKKKSQPLFNSNLINYNISVSKKKSQNVCTDLLDGISLLCFIPC